MKKALLSLALVAGMAIAAPVANAAGHGHHGGPGDFGHHGGGHHGGGHHGGGHGFPFPIPIPIPVPTPNPYPSPYCTPGYDCYERAPIRIWVWETEFEQYPYPHEVRVRRLVTARWDYRRGGYWYWNNQGRYVRVA